MAPAEFAPDYVEETWKWSIRTETLPGWLYSVEESPDLVNWTLVPNSYFYGNGTQLKSYLCDGPPPPSEAAPTNGNGTGTGGWSWQVHHFSLTLRMQEGGASSSYFLQRESADPESPNAWQTNLTETLPAQVVGTRNFSMLEWSDPTTHLLYWVDVHVIIGTDAPPTADPAHPPLEADLGIYEHIKPQLLARLLTPDDPNAPSNTPSNSKFARVRRTAIDSNGNGYPDWYELENFAPGSVFAPEGSSLYVSGNADADGDGFTAGEEAAGRTSDIDPTSHPPAFTRLVILRKSSTFFSDATTVATHTDYIGWPVLWNYVEFPFPLGMILKWGTHTTNVGVATTPQLLNARVLSLRLFPGTPATSSYLRSVIAPVIANSTFQHTPMTPDRLPRQQASVENVAVWLEHKPIETEPVSVTFLLVPRTRSGETGAPLTGAWTTGQIQTVTLTVPAKQTGQAGQTLSATKHDLVPEFPAATTDTYSLEAEMSLLPVEFKTYATSEAGPDKAHKLNLNTRQSEKTTYGQGWEKCVSKVWDTNNTVNLIDYLDGGTGNHATYENVVRWKINGTAQNTHSLSLGSEPSDNEHRPYYVEVLSKTGGDTIDRLIITLVPRSTKTKFDAWHLAEKADLTWLGQLVNLFASFDKTPLPDGHYRRPDRNFQPWLYSEPGGHNTRMHPDSYFEARSYQTSGGHGHQMNFDQDGELLKSGISAGSADKAAPFPHWIDHGSMDVKPFVWALQLDGTPADQDGTTLTEPIMHEGANFKKYSECRPTIANNKPILADGATP